jgi:predicted dehydrogenase
MNDVDLAGVVDIDESKARSAGKKFSTTPYFSHEDLAGKVDAVSIVVPTKEHFKISKYFLEHDVDILIEKPMTISLKEADALIDIAESKGLLIQVGHLERFNPAVMALEGIIKKPMFIESHRLSMYQPRGTDVSVVLDLMIHDIDIILNYVQSDVKNIHAAGIPVISKHVDIANARLEFESGCVANVTASRISMKKERKIRLFQRDAYVAVDFAKHEITVISQNGTKKSGIIPGMDIKELCFTKGDALEDELTSFVKAVKQRVSPEVTGQMGRDALRIAIDIMDQIQSSSHRFLSA